MESRKTHLRKTLERGILILSSDSRFFAKGREEKGEDLMDNTQELSQVEKGRASGVKHGLLTVLLTICLLLGAAYGAGYILLKGPSPYAARQFAAFAQGNPALQLVLDLYMSREDQQILLPSGGDGAGAAGSVRQFSVHPQAG